MLQLPILFGGLSTLTKEEPMSGLLLWGTLVYNDYLEYGVPFAGETVRNLHPFGPKGQPVGHTFKSCVLRSFTWIPPSRPSCLRGDDLYGTLAQKRRAHFCLETFLLFPDVCSLSGDLDSFNDTSMCGFGTCKD